VAFLPGSRQAVSVGEGRSVRLWEPEQAQAESGDAGDMEARFAKKLHTQFLPHGSRRPGFQLATAAGRLFVATGDGPVKQFDVTTSQPGADLLGSTGWTFSVAVQPKTLRVAAGSHDGAVHIWDATTGKLTATFIASPGLSAKK
jgi:WD40 repeat protein